MRVNVCKLLGLLFTIIFVLSTVNVVHSVEANETIMVGKHPFGAAYDWGKNEVFVTNYFDNSVSVISDRDRKSVV
jgi:DNA-binding beta-propeller fold protein YncE